MGTLFKSKALSLSVLPLLILLSASVWACCMVPIGYEGGISQTAQNGLIFHHNGKQALTLRIQPTFPKLDKGPSKITWIITVPNSPTHYGTVGDNTLDAAWNLESDLLALAKEQWGPINRPKGLASDKASDVAKSADEGAWGLKVEAPVRVGPFEITEVHAPDSEKPGELSGALNSYLAKRGFPNESEEELKWFLDRKFSFLCVEVTPEGDAKQLGKSLDLPALRIDFESEQPYYPAKYSARQGNFELNLRLITSEPLKRSSFQNTRSHLNSIVPYNGFPDINLYTSQPLPEELAEAMNDLSGSKNVKRWYVNSLYSSGFNSIGQDGRPEIMDWQEDIYFELGDGADTPGFWYYGDRELGAIERAIRIPWVAGSGILLGIVGAVYLFVRFRRKHARK